MVTDDVNISKTKFSMAKAMFEHYFETVHIRTRLWEPQNILKVKIFLTDFADFEERRLRRQADRSQRLIDDQRGANEQRYHDGGRSNTVDRQHSNITMTNSYASSTPSISIIPPSMTSVQGPSINITTQDPSFFNTFYEPQLSMHNIAQPPSMLSVDQDPSMLNSNSYQSFRYPIPDVAKDLDSLRSFGFKPTLKLFHPEPNQTSIINVEDLTTPPKNLTQIPGLVPRKFKSSDNMKQKRREAQNAAKQAAKAQDNEDIEQIHQEISTISTEAIDVNGIVITSPTNDIIPGVYTVMRVLRTSPKRRQISFEE
ncbi:unnamed protein product [Diamesa hyperborea]